MIGKTILHDKITKKLGAGGCSAESVQYCYHPRWLPFGRAEPIQIRWRDQRGCRVAARPTKRFRLEQGWGLGSFRKAIGRQRPGKTNLERNQSNLY